MDYIPPVLLQEQSNISQKFPRDNNSQHHALVYPPPLTQQKSHSDSVHIALYAVDIPVPDAVPSAHGAPQCHMLGRAEVCEGRSSHAASVDRNVPSALLHIIYLLYSMLSKEVVKKIIKKERERENSNSKTLFYKDCSLGSVKNLSNN